MFCFNYKFLSPFVVTQPNMHFHAANQYNSMNDVLTLGKIYLLWKKGSI